MLSSSLKHFQSFLLFQTKKRSLSVVNDYCKLPLKATDAMDVAAVIFEQLDGIFAIKEETKNSIKSFLSEKMFLFYL